MVNLKVNKLGSDYFQATFVFTRMVQNTHNLSDYVNFALVMSQPFFKMCAY